LPTGPVVEIFGTDFGIMFDTPGVIIALVTVLLPFAILPIYNALDSMDEDMISASHVLGASRLRTFYEVTLPQSLSGIVAATIFIFILSSGSFLAPAILGGPGNFMMANVIASSYAFNIELAAAMSVVFTLALLVIIIAFNSYISIGKVLGEL
jgi:ABC-type spermidine/putrescine transport system permease subunit I